MSHTNITQSQTLTHAESDVAKSEGCRDQVTAVSPAVRAQAAD
jgi:hypothetical protein